MSDQPPRPYQPPRIHSRPQHERIQQQQQHQQQVITLDVEIKPDPVEHLQVDLQIQPEPAPIVQEQVIPQPLPHEESIGRFATTFFSLHWIQAIPALLVGTVIIGTTIHRIVSNYNQAPGSSAPETTSTAPVEQKKASIDIEECGNSATTCQEDCSACDCPFPIDKSTCTKSEDGTMKCSPIAVPVPEDGSSQWICICGKSKNFPHCDGSHRQFNQEHNTTLGPYQLNNTTTDKKTVYICGCGHSKARKEGKPFCDGTHKNVKLVAPAEAPGIDQE